MSTQSYDGQTAAAVALAALAAAINVALAFGIIMLQSWIADGIKGDELFPWWPSGAFKPDEPRIVECILYMLLLSGLFAALLYIRRRSFLPVDVQRIGAPGRVVPRAVLVLGISRVKWKWTPERTDSWERRLARSTSLARVPVGGADCDGGSGQGRRVFLGTAFAGTPGARAASAAGRSGRVER